MRACPTQAIRVKDGKAKLLPMLCIDCGLCLKVCPSDAIQATTWSFDDGHKFKYKVAVPAPVLLGQFPMGISPAHVAAGLRDVGFDAVWDMAVELALANRATLEYVCQWEGAHPLISVYCPVIVRLVQVLYPSMVDQLIRLQAPREHAGRELKRTFSQKLGIDRDEIAAIFITPCQAKTISIIEPAEGAKSNFDGALGISDVYNDILASTHVRDKADVEDGVNRLVDSVEMLRWSTGEGQAQTLSQHRYMSVTGLSNVMHVFEDIEKGRLRNVEYLECCACWGGCVGGNLTVDNAYITLSKIHRLLSELPESGPRVAAEVERRYPYEDFSLKGELRPRDTEERSGSLHERVDRIIVEESVSKELPGLNCGLCGAPTCRTLAKDVAAGAARQDECIFFSDEPLEKLRQAYLSGRQSPP